MTDAQYWQWFWLNAYYGALFSIPVLIGCAIWAIVAYHAELHENDEPKQHFTELKLR